jgi:hypothetical protein
MGWERLIEYNRVKMRLEVKESGDNIMKLK